MGKIGSIIGVGSIATLIVIAGIILKVYGVAIEAAWSFNIDLVMAVVPIFLLIIIVVWLLSVINQ